MTNSTEKILTRELILCNPPDSFLTIQVVDLDLIEKDNALVECRLTFQITLDLYQQIDTNALFNLKKELRGALNAASFHNETNIEIETTLQPQLLTLLAEHTTDPETAISYLIACSQEISENSATQTHPISNPLLSTESWVALKVRQHQESGEIGYRTFWSYLNPAALTPEAIANGQFPEAMEQFLKDRNEANLAMAGQAISEVLEEISNDLKNWDETKFRKKTETVISDFFSEVTHAFENWVEPKPPIGKTKTNPKGKIYQAMLNFFSEEDWEFTKLQGELTLRLACKGKNGEWNCYALANETQQRFLFYSIYPQDIPPTNRIAIAELLSRANHGIEIGNFELDFDSGEIRFKTSLDVTGDRITPALIKQLVYINVLTIDQYLPSIQAVLDGATPIDAIQAIAQP
jgi:hypothetical protein